MNESIAEALLVLFFIFNAVPKTETEVEWPLHCFVNDGWTSGHVFSHNFHSYWIDCRGATHTRVCKIPNKE